MVYFDAFFNRGRISGPFVFYVETGGLKRNDLVLQLSLLTKADSSIDLTHSFFQIETFLVFDFVLGNAVAGQNLARNHLLVINVKGVIDSR